MKMNSIFVKLLVSILIVLTLFNFISSINIDINYSFAEGEDEAEAEEDDTEEARITESEEKVNGLLDGIGKIFNLVFVPLKGCALIVCTACRSVNYFLASAGGVTGGNKITEISPFDIFFNRFTLLDANIFSTTDRDGNALNPNGIVYKIRTNAAIWYYAIRTLAISIIAIMLVWNLVRSISKSTSVDQKVVSKNAVTDWVLSFALVMFMHIIIIVVINFNDVLLSAIEKFNPQMSDTSSFFDALENAVFASNLILGIVALVVYGLLNWYTFKYILVYIQRLLTIMLLIMISPIVPVTYSTDRMRGGKGAALNTWLKELIFNVFIQVLHALIYSALVGVSMSALTSAKSSFIGIVDLGTALLAIASMLFIKYAEKLLKSIFGFDSSQVLNHNVFKDAATTVINAASTAQQFGARVSSSMTSSITSTMPTPLPSTPSFGQNIGQLTQGAGNSLNGLTGNLSNTLRNNMGMNGLSNLGNLSGMNSGANSGRAMFDFINDGMQNDNGGYVNLGASLLGLNNGNSNVEDGESEVEVIDTEEKPNVVSSFDTNNPEIIDVDDYTEVDSGDIGGGVVDDEKQEIKDRLQDEESENIRVEFQNLASAEEAHKKDLENVIEQINSSNKENVKSTETVTNITNNTQKEEVSETYEEIHENNVEETVVEQNSNNQSNPTPTSEEIEKLSNEIKTIFEAMETKNFEMLDKIKNETNDKLNEVAGTLDKELADKIESDIDEIFTNPIKLAEYIDTLPEDSKEREVAELYTKLEALFELDDDELDEEKRDELLSLAYYKLFDAPANNSENASNKVQENKINNDIGSIKPEIITVGETVNKKNEVEVEAKADSKSIDMKSDVIKQAREAALRFGVTINDENDLRTEFESRLNRTEHFMKMNNPTMNDIIDGLDPEAKKQYRAFKQGRIALNSVTNSSALNAVVLEREARALQMIEAQAAREGFKMEETGSSYEGTINVNGRKDNFHSDSARGVIEALQNSKKRGNITMTNNNRQKRA